MLLSVLVLLWVSVLLLCSCCACVDGCVCVCVDVVVYSIADVMCVVCFALMLRLCMFCCLR